MSSPSAPPAAKSGRGMKIAAITTVIGVAVAAAVVALAVAALVRDVDPIAPLPSAAAQLAFARRAGVAAFALGLATEVLADAQKFLFKRSNPGALCDVGVWGVSQHPNWFGNLCLWSGVFLYNAPGLAPVKLALGALSPLSLGALFYAQGSGALTPTVALARAKYGGDPAYAAYLAATPMLLPNPAAWIGALLRGVVGKW